MAKTAEPSLAHAKAARLIAQRIVATLRDAGHSAYFAGGCVRDELLGLHPTDYDVATDATPDRIRRLFRRTNEVGAAFGVMLVSNPWPTEIPHPPPSPTPHSSSHPTSPAKSPPDWIVVEVATFRSDSVYSDSRRPDAVHFSDAPSDAARRDFTINALFLDPLANESTPSITLSPTQRPHSIPGRVIDYVGGLDDLHRRLIRAVGDPNKRLAEDHLRALRAVRFAARLNFDIQAETFDAIRAHAAELKGVSRERIGEELKRMFLHPSRALAAHLLERLTLDVPVLLESPRVPEALSLPPRLALPTLSTLTPSPFPSTHPVTFSFALAAWALDRAQPFPANSAPFTSVFLAQPRTQLRSFVTDTTQRYRAALCLSNDDSRQLSDVFSTFFALLCDWDDWRPSQRKRLAANQPAFDMALNILTPSDPARSERILNQYKELASDPVGIAPPPLLTGDDLIAQGYKPGPHFKPLLDQIYDAQLENQIHSLIQALELARRLSV